jgi:hypothetical protein
MRVSISGLATVSLADAVQLADRVDQLPLLLACDAGRIAHVVDRVALGVELDTLKAAGQKAGAPLPLRDRLRIAAPTLVSTTKPGRSSHSLPRP